MNKSLAWRYNLLLVWLLLVLVLPAIAQNYEEAKVPPYILPDPLVFQNGTKVKTPKQWRTKRRAEIIELCENEMYGRSPVRPANMTFKVWDQDKTALNGIATRKQITVYFTGQPDGPQMEILLYLPNQVKGKVPVFLGLNFQGNQGVNPDTAIKISYNWVWAGAAGVVNNRSTEKSRGSTASRWPLDLILARGYGVATVFANDIDPDYFDNFQNGVHALYPELQNRGDNFSTMSAWAWGLSRALDYLQTDPDVHPNRVMLFGFSRMGKAALWAGVRDERFAMVISNESGGGGAALSKRNFGEDVERLNRGNPHWFCQNFRKYNKNEAALPFDQHMVISLIAPRPVYVASAEQDLGADPKGEYLGIKAADPVYRFLRTKGLPATGFPKVHQPVWGRLAYHIRAGKHDVTRYDWEQFLNFADYTWKKQK
ncbi:glucuronyl esterase domain-containing protein [Adhaeribacter rhizoryzae]|uniref:Acetylxylan esterase n=1 Tax=Adhaeribacter rhizoryzae TaxID=2607907 RepID=A0A5M6D069_9BACT|nr:acetylxylan esterase [Adhaeribacter rhizoryzae]KAA5540868.1 acetylxylan esterase [Adhaeribacter rhizoryzae]